jgi:hypothetical protein
MVRQYEASFVDPVGNRELLRPITLGPEGLPSHAPAAKGSGFHAVLPQSRGDAVPVWQRRRERSERDGTDRRTRIGLAVEALGANEPGLINSVVLYAAGDDALDLPELRQPEPGVEVGRPDVEARTIKGERPIELEDPVFVRLGLFLLTVEVFRPAVRSDLEEDVRQLLVIRADRWSTDDGRRRTRRCSARRTCPRVDPRRPSQSPRTCPPSKRIHVAP